MSGRSALCSTLPDTPDAHDLLMRELIADELDQIRVVLEAIGEQLCGDPQIVRSHFTLLQKIDELCQRNENLGRTLRAEDMTAALSEITLETLRVRLQGALTTRAGSSGASST